MTDRRSPSGFTGLGQSGRLLSLAPISMRMRAINSAIVPER